jgi:bacterioferritin (cytochrome b1)
MSQKVIDLLNQARSAELGAITQYMIHHYEWRFGETHGQLLR